MEQWQLLFSESVNMKNRSEHYVSEHHVLNASVAIAARKLIAISKALPKGEFCVSSKDFKKLLKDTAKSMLRQSNAESEQIQN